MTPEEVQSMIGQSIANLSKKKNKSYKIFFLILVISILVLLLDKILQVT
jgi:hypothetical protein